MNSSLPLWDEASPRPSRPNQVGRYKTQVAYIQQRRAWLRRYKVELGCADCGYNTHPDALEFDHLPGSTKVKNVGQLYLAPAEQLLGEIEKCEVVCANCHRLRTARRRGAEEVDLASLAEMELPKSQRQTRHKPTPTEIAQLLDRFQVPESFGKHRIQRLIRSARLEIRCEGSTLLAAQKIRRSRAAQVALFDLPNSSY